MQDSRSLDEIDLAIINALQIAPRASWTKVGSVLDISLDVMASMHDLYLNVIAADLRTLSRWVLVWLSGLPGVRSTRTEIVTHMFSEAARWRMDALSAAQQKQLASEAFPPSDTEIPSLRHGERALVLGLAEDGRRSAAELAALSRCSEPTTRRRLARLIRNRWVSLRCEVAHDIAGWPVTAICWAKVPPDLLERTSRESTPTPQDHGPSGLAGGGEAGRNDPR